MASEHIAQRKLMQRKAAATLDMLRATPGNRLKALKIVREAPSSISINGQ